MRSLVVFESADPRFGELGQAHQQVAFPPGIVGAPSGAGRLPADAGVEHVTRGEVAIGPLGGRQFGGIALLTAESTEETTETAATVLRVAVAGRQREQQTDRGDGDSSM